MPRCFLFVTFSFAPKEKVNLKYKNFFQVCFYKQTLTVLFIAQEEKSYNAVNGNQQHYIHVEK